MAQYAGMSLREIYEKKCEDLHCKKNSAIRSLLPTKPDLFEVPTVLDMSTNFIGPKGLRPLLEVARCCTGLVTLDLRDQQMENDTIEMVCDALRTHRTLTKLNVSNNPLTIAGGRVLLELAKANPVVETIIIENTEIRPVIANSIAAQLAKNASAKAPKIEDVAARHVKEVTAKSEGSVPTMDHSVVRNALAAFPSTVCDTLFDENPINALNMLCGKHGALFFDTQFPPDPNSIQRSVSAQYGDQDWRRISAINPEAAIYSDNKKSHMPRDTPLSFSWLFSSVQCTLEPEDIEALVTPNSYNPLGVYTVKLYVDGAWRYIVVDDHFPVRSDGNLAFTKPINGKYFWCCIFEKAMAKLHCGYQALDQAVTVHHPVERRAIPASTMQDITGGIALSRDLHHEEFNADEWWNTLLDLHTKQAKLVAISAKTDDHNLTTLGVTPAHGYQVLHVRQINGFRLLHLNSIWADRTWSGEWSDKSALWEQYPDIALAFDFKSKKDNSFWIPYVKFLQCFSSIHLCRTFAPTAGINGRCLEGQWTRATAGGPYFEQSWCNNPRFRLTLATRSSVFLHLTLPDTRFANQDADTLAFHVIRTDYYPIKYDKDNLAAKTNYVITNAISFEGHFEEGEYWIIPSTYTPGVLSRFMLRVFSSSPFSLEHEQQSDYWKQLDFTTNVESTGEYQNGEDNPQYAIQIPSHPEPVRFIAKMFTPESDQLSLALFLCVGTGKGARLLGSVPEDKVLAKSKFVISDSVALETNVTGGDMNYVLLPCINPERTRTLMQLTMWCSHPKVAAVEMPMWSRKTVTCEWASSGQYQDSFNNPQFELVAPIPNVSMVVKLEATGCTDPSIIFFVVDNAGRQGEPLKKGPIPDDKIVMKSIYIRADTVIREIKIPPHPVDSYVIVPCLQPPGSRAKCTLTVSCMVEDFQLHCIDSGSP